MPPPNSPLPAAGVRAAPGRDMMGGPETPPMVVPLLLASCAVSPGDPASDSAPGDPVHGPAYATEVRPILDRVCARCHNDVGLAPSFADAAANWERRALIASRVRAGEMPPAAPDPGCRDYAGSDVQALTDAEKETLYAWAESTVPPAAEEPSSAYQGSTLAPFDLEIYGGAAYTPNFDGDGNDYRCFGVKIGNAETTWIDGLEAIVDNGRILHHVVVFQVDEGVAVDLSPEGFSCGGLGASGWTYWTGWAPGALPVELGEDTATSLPPNATVVLNFHYYGDPGTTPEPDRSGYGFRTRDEPTNKVVAYTIGSYRFTVPAYDPAYVVDGRLTWSGGDAMITGIWPHMHLLGRGFAMTGGATGDEDCLVRAEPWDFHNQVPVNYVEPFVVHDGDLLKWECQYDNSAENPYQYRDPPEDSSFGEETGDEMCFAFTFAYAL